MKATDKGPYIGRFQLPPVRSAFGDKSFKTGKVGAIRTYAMGGETANRFKIVDIVANYFVQHHPTLRYHKPSNLNKRPSSSSSSLCPGVKLVFSTSSRRLSLSIRQDSRIVFALTISSAPSWESRKPPAPVLPKVPAEWTYTSLS